MAAVSPAGPDPKTMTLRIAVIHVQTCCDGMLFRAAGLRPSRYDNDGVKILDNIRSDEYAKECSGRVVKPGSKSPIRSAGLCDQMDLGAARASTTQSYDLL